jgi:Fe-S cluster biogenesis protein NfuA
MTLGFRLHAERTPNPDSIKWVVGDALVPPGQTAQFDEAPAPDVSPLARALFGVEGVVGVFFASNFATVTKRADVEWTDIAQPIVDAIKACCEDGSPALGPGFEPPDPAEEGPVVARIRSILDDEIRPAVAQDGGDIVFAGYRDGMVEVYMQGACSGCPSSTATLRLGIEARLREEVPEVVGVVAL